MTASKRPMLQYLSADLEEGTRCRHPHGWFIVRRRRSFRDPRGFAGPLVWWEVRSARSGRPLRYCATVESFDKFGQARDWCDEYRANPQGWPIPAEENV